eukprot:Hpha_TRINITY_DN2376_c0_g1::TRINITY_DN2376_c0_g1_i1::g.494::m.494
MQGMNPRGKRPLPGEGYEAVVAAVFSEDDLTVLSGLCERISTRGRLQERHVIIFKPGVGNACGSLLLLDLQRTPQRHLSLACVAAIVDKKVAPQQPAETLLQIKGHLNEPDLLLRWPDHPGNSYATGEEATRLLASVCPKGVVRNGWCPNSGAGLHWLMRRPDSHTPFDDPGRTRVVRKFEMPVNIVHWGATVNETPDGVRLSESRLLTPDPDVPSIPDGWFVFRVDMKYRVNKIDDLHRAVESVLGTDKVSVEFCNCPPWEVMSSQASEWSAPQTTGLWTQPDGHVDVTPVKSSAAGAGRGVRKPIVGPRRPLQVPHRQFRELNRALRRLDGENPPPTQPPAPSPASRQTPGVPGKPSVTVEAPPQGGDSVPSPQDTPKTPATVPEGTVPEGSVPEGSVPEGSVP